MGHQALVLSIFVSSPGDVSEDRSKVLAAISAWNQRNGASRNVFFNALTWEGVVSPDRRGSGQEVIDEQIGTAYDIYLGLMWGRFGTPTKNAKSGTEDEFDQAVARHKAGERLAVAFLFNRQAIPQDILDGEQFQKVQEFKKKVAAEGCFYREYADEVSLNDSINLILDRAANRSQTASLANSPTKSSQISGIEAETSDDIQHFEELGILDLEEALEEQTAHFVAAMEEMSAKLAGIGESANEATEELRSISRFGEIEPMARKKIINKVASDVEKAVDWGESKQNEIDAIIEKSSELMGKIAEVSLDFDIDEEGLSSTIASGEELVESIRSNNASLRSLARTALGMPRISKESIRANKRLAALMDRMILKNQTFAANVEIANSELMSQIEERRSS